MKSFQDRLCDFLTALGLLGVIGWGVYTLTADNDSTEPQNGQPEVGTPGLKTDSADYKTAVLDTLEDKLVVEDQPVIGKPMKDTLKKESPVESEVPRQHKDSLHQTLKDTTTTSVRHPKVHQATVPVTTPTAKAVPQSAVPKASTDVIVNDSTRHN